MSESDKLNLNNSLIVAVVAGAIGLLSNAYINYMESKNSLSMEKAKLNSSIRLEEKRRHTSLILNATSQKNPQDVVKSLKFFVDIGLITGEDATIITAFLNDPLILEKIPSLEQSLAFKDLKGSGRYSGTVKWFNSQKGFGFIAQDNENEPDLFFHFSDVIAEEGISKNLVEGQRVQFSIGTTEKGPIAVQVIKIPSQ